MEKVIVITGASKGIGLSTVICALEAGYKVAATSRNKETLQKTVEEKINSQELIKNFFAVEMEFTKESIKKAIGEIINHFSHIDILVNNAGYAVLGALEDISLEAAKANFDVNVFGLLEVTKAVIPYLRKQGAGQIINIASISGSVTGPSQGIYAASKAAVIMMSETLAYELENDQITVTAVCPSGVRTDFLDQKSMRQVNGSNKVVSNTLEGLAKFNHNQSGNPDLVGKAIIKLTKMTNPPLRLYLGRPAILALEQKIEEITNIANEYMDLSLSIDDK